ncbi:hypothetical protein BOX15_Mlig019014g1 [Macrostomum lignano]|uniref:Cytochrome P450 n=1 Tax=Macrostomum lignano TaxID=282301 RepID=A0A267FI18_9PLAT|nr:hypothetical protein BOX15_Mlig017828g1 [Macrostomum lignano]PAA72855.1 hypothetical protein BOX15_Mlig019014g1 [Macrostomum lignano]
MGHEDNSKGGNGGQSSLTKSLLLPGLILLLLLLLAVRRRNRRHVTCDAPGPPAWPLIGSHFHVELPLWRWVEREGKARYGPVIQVRFPDHLAVIVSGYDEIREVFLNESLLGRPQLPWRKQVGGLALSEGKLWRAHRTFSVRALNDFGWGRPACQADVAEESRQIVQEIRDRLPAGPAPQLRSAELDVGELVTQSVSAVISRMIFGCEQVAYDERFYSKLPLMQSIEQENRLSLAQTLMRRLGKLPWPLGPAVRRLLCLGRPEPLVMEALRMCQEQIDKRRRSLRHSQQAGGAALARQCSRDYSDYIEFYLREKTNYFSDDENDSGRRDAAGDAAVDEATGAATAAETAPDDPAAPSMRDGRLAMTIFDLMTGGVDAVANLVRWALLLASLHPEAQRRLREELEAAGGDASYADKDKLPYAEAFLEEVQRFVSLLPEGVVRRAVDSTTIGGYRVPKGARIIPNLYGVHHDPLHFPEPDRFQPDRFLRYGRFQPSRHLLPFSLGKRACPGEALARMEAFTLLTAILRRFSVALPDSEAARLDSLLRGSDGFVRRVVEHRLVFTELPQPPPTPPTPPTQQQQQQQAPQFL